MLSKNDTMKFSNSFLQKKSYKWLCHIKKFETRYGVMILKTLKVERRAQCYVCISTNKCDRKSTHCVSHTLDGGKSIASTSRKQLEQFKCVPYQRKVFK